MAFLFGFTQPSQAQTKTVSSQLIKTYQTISKAFLVGRKFRGDTVGALRAMPYLTKIYPIKSSFTPSPVIAFVGAHHDAPVLKWRSHSTRHREYMSLRGGTPTRQSPTTRLKNKLLFNLNNGDCFGSSTKRAMTTLLLAIFLSSVICHPSSVLADTLTSPAFEIDMSTINITGGSKSSASFKLTDTVGQTFQGRFDSAGFVLKAGFQYIYTLIPFTFTISNLDLDFGSLISGTPSLLTNLLTVTTGSTYGYTVKAIEDHPLRLNNGVTTIPDTSCDLASPCTQSDATVWADNARYGFGYNIQGTDVDIAEFVDNTYFRPFPVQNLDQPATIMSRVGVATDSAATVTYKVNISGSQAAGTYQNNLQFIAIPSF